MVAGIMQKKHFRQKIIYLAQNLGATILAEMKFMM
jgi:hypothetical protein